MLETPSKAMAELERGAGAPPTFAVCAARFIELRRPVWTTPRQAVQWEQTLTRHAYPHIGHKGVDQITQADIMAVLEPIWASSHDTGLRVRQRIHAILEWATAQGYRNGSNPADSQLVFRSLPRQVQVKPHRALSYTEVPAALRRVTWSNAYPPARLSFRLMVLTAAWPSDVRFIEWPEIDWDQRIWMVPAARVRSRWVHVQRPHRIPLSRQAMRLLEDAWDLSGPEGLVFPTRPMGDSMSNAALLRLLWRLDIPATPSGFRNSFHDWCAETDVPRRLVKTTISRTTGRHSPDAAFLRTHTFQRMRKLMQQWADFCTPDGLVEQEATEEQDTG